MIRILFFPSVCHIMKGPLNLHMDENRNTEMSLRGKAWVGGLSGGWDKEGSGFVGG